MEINTLDIFNNAVNFQGLGTIVSLFLTFVIGIYTVYAFLMFRQVRLLNKSFHTDTSFILRYFALGHLFATLLLLLFTVISIF